MVAVTGSSVPALGTDELYRFFRTAQEETAALRGVALTVWAGEFVAVAGPSGSGKSTLLQCLAGLDDPDGGSVRVCGELISHQPQSRRTRIRARLIGMLFQQGNLFDHLTVAENIRLVRTLSGVRVSKSGAPAVLGEVGLSGLGNARPAQLSGGELARAGLAVVLANSPSVLIADEPTGELDPAAEHHLLFLLRRRCTHGTAVVVASHSPAVRAAADRVLELCDGRMR